MGDLVKQILAAPIQLADQVIKAADEAATFKPECAELKSKTERLAGLLRQAARASGDLYERPTRRIVNEANQVLDRALALAHKCRPHGLVKRVFTLIPTAAFRKMFSNLENSIGDVSWLLRASAPADDEILGLPPIAANEPTLGFIWNQIALLSNGSVDDRANAAESLVSLARDNPRNGKAIIEEGGVGPLLKLLKEGKLEGQENAARAIGLLGKDPDSIEHMMNSGACQVFVKILKEAPMKPQAVVAWVVSEFAARHPDCKDLFAEQNIIRLLVAHLAFETVQEHSKYIIPGKATSVHAAVVLASSTTSITTHLEEDRIAVPPHPLGKKQGNQMHNVVTTTMAMSNNKAREAEDPATKVQLKAMSARALWKLAKGNVSICRSITESRALLCFAVLLEKGLPEIRYNSAMALMEITAVAENDSELRRSAFKPDSPACKAVVDQLYQIILQADSDLLIPCIKAIGNLARTFKATETRMIGPLVNLLDEREPEVTLEACIALAKFACTENYLHVDHSKAIIAASGAKHLIQLAYFGEQIVQRHAFVLLSYIAKHVADSEELGRAEALTVLEWGSKQAALMQNEDVEALLLEAKGKLELYQSRRSRGFH